MIIADNGLPPVGIMGFGAFGTLMADALGPHLAVRAFDPDPGRARAAMRAGVGAGLGEVAGSPVVVLAVPVCRLAATVADIAPHLRAGALVLDVGSVKSAPAEIMARGLPPHVDILATHPLFGPESARDGLAGHRIALCPVRGARAPGVAAFLRRRLGLEVILTTPDEHDREAAIVQGLTHLVARALAGMEPLPRRMTTRSFDHLVAAMDLVRNDAPEVFEAIARANPHAEAVRRRFIADLRAIDDALATVRAGAPVAAPRLMTALPAESA